MTNDNFYHFEILASKEYDDCIALTISCNNLPEDPSLIADSNYNQRQDLPLENEFKFQKVGVDPVKLNQSAQKFLENYVRQQGLEGKVNIKLDNNWKNSGFDTESDVAMKCDAWLEYRTTVARNLSRLMYVDGETNDY